MKRTNYYFPDDLIARVKAHAEARQTTASDVIRRAIEEYLQRETGAPAPIVVQVTNYLPGAVVTSKSDRKTGQTVISIKGKK